MKQVYWFMAVFGNLCFMEAGADEGSENSRGRHNLQGNRRGA